MIRSIREKKIWLLLLTIELIVSALLRLTDHFSRYPSTRRLLSVPKWQVNDAPSHTNSSKRNCLSHSCFSSKEHAG